MELNQSETTTIQKTKQKFSAGQTIVDCQLKMIPAVILHPSPGSTTGRRARQTGQPVYRDRSNLQKGIHEWQWPG